jgi:RNA polymerase sigma factor (TIGR02999 family)
VADEITELLAAWASHDPGARDRLVPLVYDELHRLAAGYMRGERVQHTLQPTALVHEMYLRIGGIDRMQWRDRAHFMAMAATMMRRVLVEHARNRAREKRGGGVSVASLGELDVVAPETTVDVTALDEALDRLAALDR